MQKSDIFFVQKKESQKPKVRQSKTFKHTNEIFNDMSISPQKWNKVIQQSPTRVINSPQEVQHQKYKDISKEKRIEDGRSNIFFQPAEGEGLIYGMTQKYNSEIKPYNYNWWAGKSPKKETPASPIKIIKEHNQKLEKPEEQLNEPPQIDHLRKAVKNFSEVFDCNLGKYYATHKQQTRKEVRMLPTNMAWNNYDSNLQAKDYPKEARMYFTEEFSAQKPIIPEQLEQKENQIQVQVKEKQEQVQPQKWEYKQLLLRGMQKKFDLDKLREIGQKNNCYVNVYKNDFNEDNKLAMHQLVVKQIQNQDNLKDLENYLLSQGARIIKNQKISEQEFMKLQQRQSKNEIKPPINEGYRHRMEQINKTRSQKPNRVQSANPQYKRQ